MPWMDTGPWRVWASLLGAEVCVAVAAVACWLQTSFVGWLTALGVLAILLVVVSGYDLPGRYLVRAPFGWLIPLTGAAGLASVSRFGRLRWPHVSSVAMGGIVVTMVVLAFVIWGLREPAGAEVQGQLVFPLRSGTWVVAAGGVAALNHHLMLGTQTGALDLVSLRGDGARADGVAPRDLASYQAYASPVVSPCCGLVVSAVDGEPERLWSRAKTTHPAGNHVRIDTGTEIIQLAHLRTGSILVSAGDQVVAGQPIGEVGCSGRTSEPSLHLHAERGEEGLRLRFCDVPARRLRPGFPIGVTNQVSHAPEP